MTEAHTAPAEWTKAQRAEEEKLLGSVVGGSCTNDRATENQLSLVRWFSTCGPQASVCIPWVLPRGRDTLQHGPSYRVLTSPLGDADTPKVENRSSHYSPATKDVTPTSGTVGNVWPGSDSQ